MAQEIKLPEIAANVDSAIVLTILVSEGDRVEKDQNILEMESDKATFELPSDYEGIVKEIKVSEGDEVQVGDVVMILDTEGGEAEEKPEQEPPKKEEQKEEEKEKQQQEGEEKEGKQEQQKEKEYQAREPGGEKEKEKKEKEGQEKKKQQDKAAEEEEEERPAQEEKKEPQRQEREEEQEAGKEVAASPSIRRLARELGVDIHKVEGTGPYERITAEDVKSYAKDIIQKSDQKAAPSDDYELPDFSSFGEVERKPVDNIRLRIGKNMTASWQSIPHVFQFDKADVTELENFRSKYSKEVEKQGGKLTVTAILLKILAKGLETFPKFNASLDMKNGEIVYKKYYHIGVAVDTERGLLVPVIRNVDQKSIVTLSVELGEMAQKARNKKIMPDELQGGNMAISNLGGIGGTNFTPIIYRPNVAILGVSRTSTEPVFIDGEFKPRMMLPLSLSYDHRLIDGAEAARFLRWLCEALENPLLTMFKGGE